MAAVSCAREQGPSGGAAQGTSSGAARQDGASSEPGGSQAARARSSAGSGSKPDADHAAHAAAAAAAAAAAPGAAIAGKRLRIGGFEVALGPGKTHGERQFPPASVLSALPLLPERLMPLRCGACCHCCQRLMPFRCGVRCRCCQRLVILRGAVRCQCCQRLMPFRCGVRCHCCQRLMPLRCGVRCHCCQRLVILRGAVRCQCCQRLMPLCCGARSCGRSEGGPGRYTRRPRPGGYCAGCPASHSALSSWLFFFSSPHLLSPLASPVSPLPSHHAAVVCALPCGPHSNGRGYQQQVSGSSSRGGRDQQRLRGGAAAGDREPPAAEINARGTGRAGSRLGLAAADRAAAARRRPNRSAARGRDGGADSR